LASQIILNQHQGPLPIKVQFSTVTDAPANLIVCGSVWSQTANQMLGIEVILDGKAIGSASIFSNLNATHRAVVPAYIPVKLGFGSHTLELSAANSHTISDFNDLYDAILDY